MMKLVYILFLILAVQFTSAGQELHEKIQQGNKLFEEGKYDEAEEAYQEALEMDPGNFEASFNLGDTYYMQEEYEDAVNQFEILANGQSDKARLADIYHNKGNALLKQNKYKESVEAFKEALKNDPQDAESRYNLSYALKKLQQQQNQQNQDQQNQDEKKEDQKKDQQDQKDSDKDKKDGNKDKEGKEEDKKDSSGDKKEDKKEEGEDKKEKQGSQGEQDEKKQGEEKKEGMSKQNAKQLLEALQAEEGEKAKKMLRKEEKREGNVSPIEKDW